jgi:UDP-N-acetylglucosamine:LPS N-acetylglucosamine transferase
MEVDDYGSPKMKICIVSSCGGHLTEVRALKSVYERYEHFYVLNDRVELPKDMEGKTHFIRHSERDWLFLTNLWEAWRILRRERPSLILSTGAGPAVPFALIGKLFRIPIIFVEISAQVTEPSLTGRIMYHLADRFFYQWKPLEPYFPKAIYGGLLY